MTSTKELALATLKQIRDNGPVRLQSGICYNVMLLADSDIGADTPFQLSIDLAKAWPKRFNQSRPKFADKYWPVAGEDEGVGMDEYNAWDKNTEAGARRHELLAWMIQQLEKELRDEQVA